LKFPSSPSWHTGTKNRFSKGRLLCPTKSELATKGEKQESMNCSLRQDAVPGRISQEELYKASFAPERKLAVAGVLLQQY
jgi:hypothetical protein